MDVSRYRVDTTEQVYLSYQRAGIGSRFLAVALDMIFQGIAFVLLLLAGASAGGFASFYTAFIILSAALLFFFYFILFEGFCKGRTPGKMIVRLRVIHADGRPLDWVGALGRNLFRLLDFLPALYGVGVVTMFVDGRDRRVGDIVMDTLVIHEPRRDKVSLNALRASLAPAAQVPRYPRYPLSEPEKVLLRDYFGRRAQFTPRARAHLSWRLALPLYDRFAVPYWYRTHPEDFLWRMWNENR